MKIGDASRIVNCAGIYTANVTAISVGVILLLCLISVSGNSEDVVTADVPPAPKLEIKDKGNRSVNYIFRSWSRVGIMSP